MLTSKLTSILGYSVALVIILLILGLKYLDFQRVKAVEALEQEKAALVIQTQRAEALEKRILDIFNESKVFEKTALDINNKYAKAQRDLETLRGRETTVVAKPTLVALKINKAYEKRQKELACLTGDFNLCTDK